MNPYGFTNAPPPGYVQFGGHDTVFMSTPDTFAPITPSSYSTSQSGSVATSGLSHSTSMDFSNSLSQKHDFELGNQLMISSSDMTASLMSAIDPSVMVRPNGRPLAPTTTNTNSNDFTKRKNWDQRIIEELTDFLHVLSPVGKILFASPSSIQLVGYTPDELLGRSITDFLHSDDIDMFIREFNVAIHTRSEFKVYYRFRKKDDKFVTFEVIGHPYFGGAGESDVPKCFFGIAQPYPTKSGTMLDSFLELKIENEKLRKQLKLLQSQSNDSKGRNATNVERRSLSSSEGSLCSAPGDGVLSNSMYMIDTQSQGGQPKRDTENNNSMLFGPGMELKQRAPSSTGLLSTIEFGNITNESSSNMSIHPLNQNASTDATRASSTIPSSSISPNVMHKQYDNGVTIPTGASGISGQDKEAKIKQRKKKKQRIMEDEYVCHECGCVESPEWRRGPNGAKTLCNACGLRYSKYSKKQKTNGGK